MSSYKTKPTPGDTSWFVKDRFGMFIHFGLYSMPGRHEWIKKLESIPEEKYDKYFQYFNPDMFDAKELAKKAKAAGMKYAVLTTKHHEGFCLFDSKYTDYKSTNTPFGRDIVKEFSDAFRAEGIRVGFYYSLIDWHHPDFPIDINHPRRHDENAEELDRGRDMRKYAQYMRDQVTELMTNYGKVDILWFDFSYTKAHPLDIHPWMQHGGFKSKDEWEAEALMATARAINPDVIINNRAGIDQDIWTPEQFQPTRWVTNPNNPEELVTWEACQTLSGSWGYHRDEQTWKSPQMLIGLLIKTVSNGGNLIMNVGPTGRGYLDYRAENALKVYEDWMKYNGRSIYNCTKAEPEFSAPSGAYLTQSQDGKRLYIHLVDYPFAFLEIYGLSGKIDYAQFLHDGSEVLYSENKYDHGSHMLANIRGNDMVVFKLPPVKPHTEVPVIEVILK